MISTMTASNPQWQPGHVPRLSYRNPLPTGEILPQRDGLGAVDPAHKQTLSIREIREALPRATPKNVTPSQPSSPVVAQKNKKSFLGGLFVKEPSMVALDQVAQQILAQHGSISPKSVPLVSSRKMPEHVPKVNSRWAGVPDYVKMREKQEKEKTRAGRRTSVNPAPSRSRATDSAEDESVVRRRNSNAASTVESWDSRSTGSRPVFSDDVSSMRPPSVYSTSSSDSIHAAHCTAPSIAQSCTSSGSVKSPESSLYSLYDATGYGNISLRLPSSQNSLAKSASRPDCSPRLTISSSDTVPEYTSSSATTPLERSPQTPSPLADDEKTLDNLLGGEAILPASGATKKVPKQALNSGVSDKTTRRKQSVSRPALGLRTNIVVAPWESQDLPVDVVASPQSARSGASRGKPRLFGREKR